MLHLTKRLQLVVLAAALVLGLPGAGAVLAQDNNMPVAQARFQAVPAAAPAYAPSYNPYPYGGAYIQNALSGAADVIGAQGSFMVSQQKAYLMREQLHQMKIETRRKNVDEYLYERAVLPTMEDERERTRIENLRRSRNDPPATEIWSGKALNDLLLSIQHQQAQGVRGPTVPLEEDILKHINLSGGQSSASLGVLRGGKIQWPLAFYGDGFKDEKKTIDQLSGEALKQIESGPADPGTILEMTKASDKLVSKLKADVDDISPSDYIKAKRFLNEFAGTLTVLQNPDVTNYAKGNWTAKGRTVAELTQDMTKQGLKFAPAVSGDEAAYRSLHNALVEYYVYDPGRKWDAVSK